MVRRFCAKCGKPLDQPIQKGPFYMLCEKCRGEKANTPEFPPYISVYKCQYCNSYAFGHGKPNLHWKFYKDKDEITNIARIIYDEYLYHLEKRTGVSFDLELDLDSYNNSNGNIMGIGITMTASNGRILNTGIKVRIKKSTCNNCARLHGKRYNCIIQLRNMLDKKHSLIPIRNKIKEYVDGLHEENPAFFITEITEKDNGFNLKLSSNTLLRKITTFLRKDYKFIEKISKTLIGKDSSGNDLYRVTLLVRILDLAVGDEIEINRTPYRVKKIMAKDVRLENIRTRKLVTKKIKELEKHNVRLIRSSYKPG